MEQCEWVGVVVLVWATHARARVCDIFKPTKHRRCRRLCIDSIRDTHSLGHFLNRQTLK